MRTTKLLRIQVAIVLLLYLWITPLFVLGQGETTQDPAPTPSTGEPPSPSATRPPPPPETSTREEQPPGSTTTTELPPSSTTSAEPPDESTTTNNSPIETTQESIPSADTSSQTTESSSETTTSNTESSSILTTSLDSESTINTVTTESLSIQSNSPSTISITTSTFSWTTTSTTTTTQSESSPEAWPQCVQKCLAQAASDMGCGDTSNVTCICPGVEGWIDLANTCLNSCGPEPSSQAVQDARALCSSSSISVTRSNPSGSGGSSENGSGTSVPLTGFTQPPITTPTHTKPSTTQVTPSSESQGGSAISTSTRLITITTTQTRVFTPGESITLILDNELTTFVPSSALTTTWSPTLVQVDRGGGEPVSTPATGPSGSNGAFGIQAEYAVGGVVEFVGLLLGAFLVF